MADGFQWQEAYARLERARRALETGWAHSPEEIQRVLQARARGLAQPAPEAPAPAEVLELLVFSVAAEQYAIETTSVLEVVPLGQPTPVPNTPPYCIGVVNHRGRILPVLDLRALFAPGELGTVAGGQVIAVEAGGMVFGLLSQSIAGVVRVGVDEVAPPPAALASAARASLRGVTGEMVTVLDIEALARDPRIIVNEEVG